MGLIDWIYWAVGVRDDKQSINPNSMSPLPKHKFINYARTKEKVVEDNEPHQSIYHLKRMERLYGKSQRRKQQQAEYEKYESIIDKLNH